MFLNNLKNHIVTYPTPINITYFWSFGFLAGFMLFNQILTGLFLAMYYMNTIDLAFDSVEFFMRNVNYGWFIRYLHSNGASFFFIILYLHIGKALYYKSYIYPRQYIWYSGLIIFILVMGTSFLGYVLPWGQMSFWGATVITSLVTVIPLIGEDIVNWIWGGYSVGNPTLMRFFVIHYLLPFIILALVIIHILILHTEGSSNPLNFDKKNEKITFYPYFYFKDFFGLILLILCIIYIISYMPNLFNHADNYIKANPLSTPAHIVPEWYFLPYYAILRAISNKSIGIILFAISLGIFFLLPIFANINFNYFNNNIYTLKKNLFLNLNLEINLDLYLLLFYIYNYQYLYTFFNFLNYIEYNKIKINNELYSIWNHSNLLLYRQNFWILVIIFIGLGYIGQLEVNDVTIELGQNLTVLYFLSILLLNIVDRVFFYFFFCLVFIMYFYGLFFFGIFGNIVIPKPKYLLDEENYASI